MATAIPIVEKIDRKQDMKMVKVILFKYFQCWSDQSNVILQWDKVIRTHLCCWETYL